MMSTVTNDHSRRRLYRVVRRLRLSIVRRLQPLLPQKTYMKLLCDGLRSFGMEIDGAPIYIAPPVEFDGGDYRMIRIEDKVVMSSHVCVLTHDYSLARARDAIEGRTITPEIAFFRPVRIGANSFVGRGSILLPGADIGENCIIGAGSVVRGRVEANSIYVGNPGQVVDQTTDWGNRHLARVASTGQ